MAKLFDCSDLSRFNQLINITSWERNRIADKFSWGCKKELGKVLVSILKN